MIKQAVAVLVGGFFAFGAYAQCGPFPLAHVGAFQMAAVAADEAKAEAGKSPADTVWTVLAEREAAEQAQIDDAIAEYEAALAKADDVEVVVTGATPASTESAPKENIVNVRVEKSEVVVSIMEDESVQEAPASKYELAENQELVETDGVSLIVTADMTEEERLAYAPEPGQDEIARSMSEQMRTAVTYAQQANEQAAAMLEILAQLKNETEQLNSELKALREEVKKERANAAQAALDADKLIERGQVESATAVAKTECPLSAAAVLSVPGKARDLASNGVKHTTG